MMSETQGTDAAKTELMGHTDISMTNYYTNAELAALKKVTDQLAKNKKSRSLMLTPHKAVIKNQ